MNYVPDIACEACPRCWFPLDAAHNDRILPVCGEACDFQHGYTSPSQQAQRVAAALGFELDAVERSGVPILERERVG